MTVALRRHAAERRRRELIEAAEIRRRIEAELANPPVTQDPGWSPGVGMLISELIDVEALDG